MTAPRDGWLRGVVKEVPSGDTVVVMAAVRPGQGIPPEKRLTLSSLMAPKLGRRDGSTMDEPFAWNSREYLRKLVIGKACTFRIDYKLEALGGKEFGTVFVDNQNISVSVVTAGWARVREGGTQQSPFYDELLAAQEHAKSKGAGVHAAGMDATHTSIRSPPAEMDGHEMLAKYGKSKPLKAVVEAVLSGSMLRVTLPSECAQAMVMVAGIQCPSMGKRAPQTVDRIEVSNQANDLGAESGLEVQPEPFAREAKYFTESRCLNRDVLLTLEGVSQFGVLIGSLKYPEPSNSTSDNGMADLAMGLMSFGLGKAAEWSLNMMTTGAFTLRETERSARNARVGMWHNYIPQTGNSAKLDDEFEGQVSEVVSGDCLMVMDRTSGIERRVMLSSIRAPKCATRDRAAEPWGVEAKEFLRQRLIGKMVSVKMDYTRKVPISTANSAKPEEKIMSFGTIQITEKDSNGNHKVSNVAELLLVRGLAQTVKHRGDEERSAFFANLVNAEDTGKKSKKGIWSSRDAPVTRVNDLTLPGSGSKARQHLPFLQRSGRLTGICEFVLSGSRYKIYIPKESVSIAFSPSGVKSPGKDEDFSAEAMSFSRSKILQRNVEIVVDSVDKIGTFLGTLEFPTASGKMDIGVALLEAGLAKLHPMSNVESLSNAKELLKAQERAKNNKLRLWTKEEVEQKEPVQKDEERFERQRVVVTITEMCDANSFYIQFASEARAQWVAEQLASMSLDTAPAPQSPFKVGSLCLAKFSMDNSWYRAKVEKVSIADPTMPEYDIFFIDFGNRATVSAKEIRQIPPTLEAVPPQAHLATLAFIHCPTDMEEDIGYEVMERLAEVTKNGALTLSGFIEKKTASKTDSQMVWGKNVATNTSANSKNVLLHLTLFPGQDEGLDVSKSINAILVQDGLARVLDEKTVGSMDSAAANVYSEIEKKEKIARQSHLGIWEYGDPGNDDDDDGGFPSLNKRR